MAITTLDPKTALIVVDLQKGVVGRELAHSVQSVVQHAATLADAFRRHELPVVLVNVLGMAPGRAEQKFTGSFPADWSELIPQLNQQPQDHIVSKRTWGAFTNTDLEQYLKHKGVTQVVLAGIATSIGVESTARQAHELGFNVTLATDAMTDMSLEAHENSVSRIFPRLGETGTTKDVLQKLPQ
ncbi:MAG TPA: isochorismatase family protein [Candidatus Obscuribacterales bacterium]